MSDTEAVFRDETLVHFAFEHVSEMLVVVARLPYPFSGGAAMGDALHVARETSCLESRGRLQR
jgi:hypothetical protein